MSWAHWPFNNCLGTLASQHCNNTLFKMGVQNLGCYKQIELLAGTWSELAQKTTNLQQKMDAIQLKE
jgi:hypothetical protein